MRVVAYIDFDIEPTGRHLEEMRSCFFFFSAEDSTVELSLVPDSEWTVAAEFTMPKTDAPKDFLTDEIMRHIEESVSDCVDFYVKFVRANARRVSAGAEKNAATSAKKKACKSPRPDAGATSADNATPPDDDAPQTVGIVFKGAKHEMSKAQKAFMKAKEDVERMQKKLADSTEKCEKVAARHAELTAAPLADVGELQKELIIKCNALITQGAKPPHKYVRKKLAVCIRELFASLASRGIEDSPELADIRVEIHKAYFAEPEEESADSAPGAGASAATDEEAEPQDEETSAADFEAKKRYFETVLFMETGHSFNLDGLRPDMDEDEVHDYIKGVFDEYEADEKMRRKTKRQLEKEAQEKEIEEARAKNITTVYRQLARILHPDLEQDPILKKKKEALMKELTVAYEKNDLHTILGLELRWLQNNDGDIARLSDAKLDAYTAALKQQSAELFNELQNLLRLPRFASLRRLRIWLTDSLPSLLREVEKDADAISEWTKSLRQNIKAAEQFQAMPESPIRARELRDFAKSLECVLVDQTDEFDPDPFAFF